jgi:hypothetical protein
MKSYCLALVALAAIGFAGAAFAGEAKHPAKSAAPVVMSDSELDTVTAGADFVVLKPHGIINFHARLPINAVLNGFRGNGHGAKPICVHDCAG